MRASLFALILAGIAIVGIAEESPLILFTAVTGKPGTKEAVEYFGAAQKAGFSQMMLYPRSGLEWDYMGEEWLSFVGDCLVDEGKLEMRGGFTR